MEEVNRYWTQKQRTHGRQSERSHFECSQSSHIRIQSCLGWDGRTQDPGIKRKKGYIEEENKKGPQIYQVYWTIPALLSCVPVQVTRTSNKPRGKIRNALELDAMHTMQGLIIAHYASPIFSLVDSCELTNIRQSSSNWRGRRISLQIYVKGLRSKFWSGDIWNFYLSLPWNPDSFLKSASSRIV